MMRLSFSNLKEKLERKFSFISAIESESDFYLGVDSITWDFCYQIHGFHV